MINAIRRAIFGIALSILGSNALAQNPPHLIRSLSGPSGKVSGTKFEFDETRNRFVYPQDSSVTVYFEWDSAPGTHVLSGSWKQPDGRVASLSPDVKMVTQGRSLNCYWIFSLTPGLQIGVWSLEIRIDGQPSGSHPFEIAGTERPPAESESVPKQLSLDEIFKAVSPSMVWIYKLDEAGRRTDATSGFVIDRNQIATAFQSIDQAAKLEVEFADGHKQQVEEVLACSRLGDWAILKADTAALPPIPRGDPKGVVIGERLILFNVETSARIIGGVDIGGRRTLPDYGERIQISPAVAAEAAGGPLLDLYGHVVAIVGGSLNPGARFPGRTMSISPALWNSFSAENAATPLSELKQQADLTPTTLAVLASKGVLTAPVTPMPEFIFGGTTIALAKQASDPTPRDISDFSRRDEMISVYSMWSKRGKLSKGEISANVYDAFNHLRVKVEPKKIGLAEVPTRVAFGFAPSALPSGVYRVDLNWNGRPVWRTFVRVQD